MPMMTGEQYRKSLLDGRRCYIDGDRVEDPSEHPLLRTAVTSVANTYDRFYDAAPDTFHPMYTIPRSREDMDRRVAALGQSDITAGTTAACMALVEVAPELGKLRPEYRDRIYAFFDWCRDKDVRCSDRHTDSAVCLVADEGDMDIHLERMLKQHRQLDGAVKRVLEVNAQHPLVVGLAKRVSEKGNADEVAEAAWLLLDQARIVGGEPLPDPAAFSKRLSEVMRRALAA